MADVYLGVQLGAEDFKRLVVIKRIPSARVGDEDSLRMLIDEARLVASLNHPHIVKIFDLSALGDDLCIPMEYVDGESLAFLQAVAFNDNVATPLPVVCKWMIEAAEALQYAHRARSPDGTPLRIIHRDIGPQNLLVDRNGYLKIIDFGIARSAHQSELTSPGVFKGKLPYVAPDVFSHTDLDGRIDLYALGLVFYELVTRTAAFQFGSDVSMAEVMQRKTNGPLAAPSTVRDDVDPVVDEFVLRATAADREARFRSGKEFADAIRELAPAVGGVASTGEVGDWFHLRFAERVAQRRQFERLAMAKLNEQPGDTPPPHLGPNRSRLSTSNTISFARIGSLEEGMPTGTGTGSGTVPLPRRANPYVLAVVIFALFLSIVLTVRFLWPDDSQVPLAKGSVSMVLDNLFITSEPPGAEVIIDGKRVGNTGSAGLNLRVEANEEHTLTLRLAGHQDYSLRFVGEPFAQRQIKAALFSNAEQETGLANTNIDTNGPTTATEKKTPRRRRRPLARRRALSTPAEGVGADPGVVEEEEEKHEEEKHEEEKHEEEKHDDAGVEVAANDDTDAELVRLEPPQGDAAAGLPLPPPPPPMLAIGPKRPRGPVHQSTNEIMRRRIAGSAPEYPRAARERAIESTVVVRVLINKDGHLRDSEVVSGDWELRPTVRKALRGWRFKPHRVAGQAVETAGTLRFVFELAE